MRATNIQNGRKERKGCLKCVEGKAEDQVGCDHVV
jgi:hypothetical protein